MSTATLLIERPAPPAGPEPETAAAAPGRGPLVAMVAGLLITALAVATFVTTGRSPGRPAAPHDPKAITLSARDVSVVTQVYEPGETSGWHAHPGIHAVAVLSGVLTVYDGNCNRQTFEPGRPYVGGQDLHLVRNETDSPVTMIVTYLNPSVPANSSRHLPPPAGCEIA